MKKQLFFAFSILFFVTKCLSAQVTHFIHPTPEGLDTIYIIETRTDLNDGTQIRNYSARKERIELERWIKTRKKNVTDELTYVKHHKTRLEHELNNIELIAEEYLRDQEPEIEDNTDVKEFNGTYSLNEILTQTTVSITDGVIVDLNDASRTGTVEYLSDTQFIIKDFFEADVEFTQVLGQYIGALQDVQVVLEKIN